MKYIVALLNTEWERGYSMCGKWIASFPGSPTPEHKHVYARRAGYLSSRGVIEIGPELLKQKGNVVCVVQPTIHSTLGVCDIH